MANCSFFCRTKCVLVELVIGVILLIGGCVVGFIVFPHFVRKTIAENLELKEDTKQFELFKNIPFPLDFKLNFFTIANPEEALKGAKPIVEIKGPYVYTENRKKLETIINEGEAEVTYKEHLSFSFNKEASGDRNDDDELHVLNIPLFAILQSLEDLDIPLPNDIDTIISEIFLEPSVFVSLKVADYTFNGIKMCDPQRTKSVSSKFICLAAMLMNLRTIKYNRDKSIMFSLLHYKTLPDGPFTVNTGTKEIADLGLVTSYKGKKYTEFWKGKETSCDAVGGRTSTFAPFVEPEGEIKMYSTDLCKTATIHYIEKSSFKDINSYKFEMTPFSLATETEKNTCVCIQRTKGLDGKSHCYNEGMIDLHNCLGAPILVSYPHLMWAKKEYQDSVIGLISKEAEANSSNYTTQVQFEPNTGVPLRVGLNIQMNIVLRPIYINGKQVAVTKDLHPTMYPLVWVQENAELSDELVQELHDQLLNMLGIVDVAKWVVIGIGVVVTVITSGFLVRNLRRRGIPRRKLENVGC